ncbi:adenosylmethionine--8-amino-7-oxononanoate transaminase [Emcibacter sp.]|uniref:adenosylmethionine--8-amino-7-oxononanoate transaminase n=1 Tax=Emcibacter sp. TaxID=1979954 RepID=UPI002AA62DDF|nr:adenosylmethionine--8-amino-7-oxononanoate transaminase [Emcibacter sp.]
MSEKKQRPSDLPEWYREGYDNIWLPYTQMKTAPDALPVVGTDGVYLELADGRKLLDGIASWWTACHGYNHPKMKEKMKTQIDSMSHVMLGGLVHEGALDLSRRLADLLPGDLNHVFFSESGSVSVEIALKMAVQFWLNQGVEGRARFASFKAGYHGDTSAAMSVSDSDDGMHKAFGGYLQQQYILSLPETPEDLEGLESFLRENRETIAGVIMEPLVQGAGGMKFHSPEILKGIADACRKADVLFILDEIFTGFGRTGTMFACEQAGVVPDIICLGKALTAGTVAMAATVATDRVYEAFLSEDPDKAFMHGPTYMANPLACAAANASLDIFEEEPVLERVKKIEGHLTQSFAQFREKPGVVDVRVRGAIAVIQMEKIENPAVLREEFVKEGVWVRPFGDVVYVTPAFSMEGADISALTEAIDNVLNRCS